MTGLSSLADERARLEELREQEERLVAAGQWAAGPATMFGALGLTGHEIANCRVLGWLLDPLAPHGLGTRLLEGLVNHLNDQGTAEQLPTGPALARTTVVLEEARGGTRADLVLYGAGWTIVVEAKLGAGEQPDQGVRLARHWPEATYVFLTRRGRAMTTGGDHDWITITWTQVRRLVVSALADAPSPATGAAVTARAAVRDYLIATGDLEHPSP